MILHLGFFELSRLEAKVIAICGFLSCGFIPLLWFNGGALDLVEVDLSGDHAL